MVEDFEQLKKRIEQLEKQQKRLISDVNKSLLEISFYPKIDLYFHIAREIKNECNFDLLKEYLIEKKIIPDFEDYITFRKNHELLRTYQDENKNAMSLMEHFKSMIKNPAPDPTLINYVNFSNLVIIKNRFEIKRKILLERGFKEDSDIVKETDELISSTQKDIERLRIEKEAKPIEDKEYFVKKEDAEKIFENLFMKKDEMIERIKELPLMSDVHLEPHNKSLYYETISNYWLGNFNASICMLSVLLESFLKEIYYYKERKHFEGTIIPLINECKTLNHITEEQKILLLGFADTIRNKYLHASLNEILPEVIVPAYKIDFSNPTKKPEPTYCTADSLPTIRSIVKHDVDKDRSRKLIIKSIKIIEEITNKNYDFQNKKD